MLTFVVRIWKSWNRCIFPQIAIAIGVLTSNRGGGRRTTLADWTWHQGAIALQGAVDVVPLLGAIAHSHCSVVGGGGWRPALGEWKWLVPLLGAIVGCHCSVVWLGGGWRLTLRVGQLWGSGRGAIAGCHCSVLWWGTLREWTWCHCWVPLHCAIVVYYGWGGGWRPTLGEWTWCHCRVPL